MLMHVRILEDMFIEAGITNEEVYITSLFKEAPANKDNTAKAWADLQTEITSRGANVSVLLGAGVLTTFTGFNNISDWRGSVLETPIGKVIPTYEPSTIAKEWTFRPIAITDWKKVRENSEFREVKKTDRRLIINPPAKEVISYLQGVLDRALTCAFDIETETNQISCISFATSGTRAMCIPFWFGGSGSIYTEACEIEIWDKIKEVLESKEIKKIAQNAQYDMTILRDKYNIHVQNLWLDTMIAFHSIYPELPKSLATLTSLYTDVNFYKYQRMTKDMDEFSRYNAMDAAVTYECAMKIYEEMKEFKVVDFYYEHMHSLIMPLMDMSRKGVLVDSKLKKELIKRITQQEVELQDLLVKLVGHELNVNSTKQMQGWLYKELGLNPKYKLRKATGEKTVSTDEETLNALYAETKLEALKVILDIRGCRKLISTYLEVTYDKEEGVERARTSYLITGTETGRLSSRETVYRTGTNMQNIPKGCIRQMFVADEGKTFINADLSQAEARVVAWLAGEDRLIKVFTDGGDIHRKNAANIFRKAEASVTKDERELAKRIVHASNYGMGPITFAKNAGVTAAEAKRLLNAYFAEYPRIKLWHMSIERQLRGSRTLTTPLGRKRTFFNRWDQSLLKEAYAYIPQSTVADVLNMGLRRLYAKYNNTDTDLLLQIHDAVLLETPTSKVADVARDVKELLTIPIRVGFRDLVIPVDVTTGLNWGDLK